MDAIADFVLNHRSTQTPPNQDNSSENQNNPSPENNSETNSSQEDNTPILIPKNDFKKQKENNTTDILQVNNTINNPEANVTVTDNKKTVSQYVATNKFELKNKRKSHLLKQHHVFLIDSSGSMLKDQIIAYAKGAVNKIAENSKNQNTAFSMVSLFDGTAQLILKQTKVLKDIETSLLALKTGGKTNLKAGFKEVKRIISDTDFAHYLHIITDGKLNAGDNLEATVLAFQTYCKGITNAQVIDAEKGIIKIGEAKELAHRIDANYDLLITQNQ